MLKKLLVLSLMSIIVNVFAVYVNGTFLVTGETVLNEDLIIGPMGDVSSTTDCTLTVNGNIVNEGTIRDGSGCILWLNCTGDFLNSGTVSNTRVILSGASPQILASGSSSTPFSPPVFDVTNTTSIIAASDLYFQNSSINLQSLCSLDLSAGYKLSLDGGYFSGGNLIGEDVPVPTSSLEMSNSAYIYAITASNLNLLGEIVVREPVTFEGNTINKGELFSGLHSSISVKENFINEGIIRDEPASIMWLNCSGDFTNLGTVSITRMIINGTTPQTFITSSSLTPIESSAFDVTNPTSLIAGSDLYFKNSNIDLQSVCSLDLTAGSKLILEGGYFTSGNIIGESASVPTSSLQMSKSAFFQNSTASNLNLIDSIAVKEPVTFEGNTINKGIIYPAVNSTIYFNDNFSNEGSINDGLFLMTVNVSGNITNSGTWTNDLTKLVGTTEQYVSLINDTPINCNNFSMLSELTTAPYQWYFDWSVLDSPDFTGETGAELYLTGTELGSGFYGTYYCETGEGNSRNIIIEGITYQVPEITSVVNDGSTVTISWVLILGAIRYDIYSSNDPYADPATWNFVGSHDNVPDKGGPSIEWSESAPVDTKKFYFVKAVY